MSKKQITACIIDDKQANIDVLQEYISIFLNQINVIETLNNLESALVFLSNTEPDGNVF